MKKRVSNVSPLKHKPLRNPGQSVDEARQDLLADHVLFPFMVIVVSVIVVGLEWQRFYSPLK